MSAARVIAVSKPTDESMTVDEFIAYVARVSNPSNQNNSETASKLLKYLIKNKHWSPFEMVHVTMEINTTRDIARQILRHRSFSFQEFSQRYADPTKDLGFVTREARLQDTKNRQNSIEVEDDPELKHMWNERQKIVIEYAQKEYDWAIRNGIAKEQARAVLPEGLTVSRMYMAGSLRSWIHYCQLRMTAGTQKEHRMVATDCWYLLMDQFPSLKDLDLISP
jgi:thymidylate synthase (FAD)